MTARRWTPGVAVLAVASVVAVGSVGAASSPQAARMVDADARSEIERFLDDLESSVAAMHADPYLAAALDNVGLDPAHSVATAQQLVADLTDDEVAQLEAILESGPSIADMPAQIDEAVDAARAVFRPADGTGITGFAASPAWPTQGISAAPPPSALPPMAIAFGATFTDNCATAGDVLALAIAVYVLNQAQSAAYALVVAVPGVFGVAPAIEVPNPVKIALAVVYGVAYAVYLALAQTFEVALDCAETKQAEEQARALPVAGPPGSAGDPPEGTVVRGSSQITVDAALEAVGDIGDQLVQVEQNVGLVTSQVGELTTAAIELNTTLSCTTGIPIPDPVVSCGGDGEDVADGDALTRVTDADDDLQTLQGDVSILRNTQHTILDKTNEEIAALEVLAALQLRLEIEANLSLPGFHPVGLFQLPPPWGHLDVVKDVTEEMVAKFGRGGEFLGRANNAYAAGQYKQAYSLYQQAYQGATK